MKSDAKFLIKLFYRFLMRFRSSLTELLYRKITDMLTVFSEKSAKI
jgi:hypothetical protein